MLTSIKKKHQYNYKIEWKFYILSLGINKHMKILFSFLFLLTLSFSFSSSCIMRSTKTVGEKLVELKILQFNIWGEGTSVPGGFEAIVNEIVRSEADFVTLSEVRNYKGVDFTNKLVNALKVKGHTYYSFLSEGSGVISKYEMVDHSVVYPLKNDRGSIHKISIKVKNQRIAVYTAHLDYTNYASYLPRGYDGLNWKKLPDNRNERYV